METRVAHVHRDSYDIYIGRRGHGFLYSSPFHKPLGMGRDRGEAHAGREKAIIAFAIYWFSPAQASLRKMARESLTGKILGCWCAPEWCHGDIIAGYLNWKERQNDLDCSSSDRE
jgi:Domain of unknown function (DUF4326)